MAQSLDEWVGVAAVFWPYVSSCATRQSQAQLPWKEVHTEI